MSSQFLLFAGLLVALAVLLWARRRTPRAPRPAEQPRPAEAPLGANHYSANTPLHPQTEFSAAQLRNFAAYYTQRGEHLQAFVASQLLERHYWADFGDHDRWMQAELLARLGRLWEAAAVYTTLLDQPVPFAVAYNNRGYIYNLLEEYELALPDFDRAIALGAATAYAYNNRGFARLRLGQATQGLADIERSLRLDSGNAYAHRNLGIYYFSEGAYKQALACFERAKQLGQHTPLVDDYLAQTRHQLGSDGEQPLPFSDN